MAGAGVHRFWTAGMFVDNGEMLYSPTDGSLEFGVMQNSVEFSTFSNPPRDYVSALSYISADHAIQLAVEAREKFLKDQKDKEQ